MQNQINMLKAMLNKGVSPQTLIQQMIGRNNNPMINNLMKMMKEGNNQGIEQFARNIFKEQNRDFDNEFNQFMQNFKN